MIYHFNIGQRIITNSVIKNIELSNIDILNNYFNLKIQDNNLNLTRILNSNTKIYGLGENVKGINKRGCYFISFNTDDPEITEDRSSLYASHNFMIIKDVKETIGIFLDTPKIIDYDLGFTNLDLININTAIGLDIYLIINNNEIEIIKEFRDIIGKSYIAPIWSFGIAQSRWGYKNKQDLDEVIKGFNEKNLPLDMLFFDIDCLDEYQDFTFNDSFYQNDKINKEYFKSLIDNNIHLIPIVDAGVKIKNNYFMYEEMMKEKTYSFDKDHNPYIIGVWPGDCLLPDFYNKKGRLVFGKGYQKYLDLGIDGFWNDMNEPALFYGKQYIKELGEHLRKLDYDNFSHKDYEIIRDKVHQMPNNLNDYHNLYHLMDDGKIYNHYDIHNMYGSKMVESAHEYFDIYNKEHNLNKKYLLFSRSSFIGSHRYSGIWTGDNAAYWSHLLMNIKMMPSLNMCGYIYSGADIGGFGYNASEDLLLRWMAFGIFTPLFRNHTCNWVRRKDYHLLQRIDIIRNILSIRYSLIPYIYNEYIKSINNDTLLFTPLSFIYHNDERCNDIEDQLLVGDSIMIAPIYNQNSHGRMVYLPEDMLEIRMKDANTYLTTPYKKGDHYIKIEIDEVVFFLRNNHILPLTKIKDIKKIRNIKDLDFNDLIFINNNSHLKEYQLYYDDNDIIKEKTIKL